MSALNSQLRQIGVAAKTQFQRPDSCPVSVCSAIAMYEEELARHRETEAKLRESLLRESDLLRQKDELILQKDILRKESEHRLLNGLQQITSLLALQSRTTKNAEVAAQLTMAANRVATLGRMHRHLHTLDNAESVEFGQFLQKLCVDFAEMATSDRPERSLVVEGTELQIPTDIAIPLGFIACELITNSIKYAKGRIVVRLQGTPMACALSISDEGPGLPQGFDPTATNGLGMKLIRALVKQIGGVLDIGKGDRGQGTRFTVRFAPQDPLVARPTR
jgi:two-component system, sensor histidine kinase PdtaS